MMTEDILAEAWAAQEVTLNIQADYWRVRTLSLLNTIADWASFWFDTTRGKYLSPDDLRRLAFRVTHIVNTFRFWCEGDLADSPDGAVVQQVIALLEPLIQRLHTLADRVESGAGQVSMAFEWGEGDAQVPLEWRVARLIVSHGNGSNHWRKA